MQERDTVTREDISCEMEIREVNVEGRFADFICSTDTIDSHGTRIEQKWDLERYKRNPVVLYAHNRMGDGMPIGKASNVRVEDGKLCARVTLLSARANPLADQVMEQWREGCLRAISVGFYPHSDRWEMVNDREVLVLTDNELRELSIVPVGSNPDALARMRERAAAGRSETNTTAPAGQENGNMDHEKEVIRLRALLDEQTGAASKKDAELSAARERSATLDAECKRLGESLSASTKRATEAEDALVRVRLESAFGKNVDPAEADHLVKLSRSAPELFEAEMKRREKRDDKLTDVAIPGASKEPGASRSADTAASFEAAEAEALARHLKEVSLWLLRPAP